MSSETQKQKPALHISVGGIRIPIWKNEGKDGSPYFNAGAPQLSYRDADGKWLPGTSYGARDLVNLCKAAMLAHSEITIRNRTGRTDGPVVAGEDEQ